ncbi:MAG: MBOAT family protein [Phycisphaerales bacterium]|nr:MBOAT family protein [Phycisphaerales bacterium]
MVFSSQTFLFVFFPIVLLLYAIAPRKARNLVLLLASMLFYLWGGGWFIGWLLVSIMGNWGFGHFACKARESERTKALKRIVGLSVVFNIGILGWFKYANFFVDQINTVAAAIDYQGMNWTPILLPIGISFFTFQANSYVFDIAKGEGKALKNPLDFALYVSLFPQLIAGPIVRYHQVATQLVSRAFSTDDVAAGLNRFALGLCKKVLIADSVSPIANAAFSNSAHLTTDDAWLGILAYTIQIYFDFSGYSDMAIGLGRMFGFRFPENFKHPYSSASMTEFWRRWHVTLSEWFRDYVYFPLGGSLGSKLLTYRNLILVFLLTGFWHGANWTFICWGIYHGFWLIFDRIFNKGVKQGKRPTGIKLVFFRFGTLLLVMIGWIVFRAENLTDAFAYYHALFGGNTGYFSTALLRLVTPQAAIALTVGSLVFFAPRKYALGPIIENSESKIASILRYLLVLVALPFTIMLIINGTFSPFLYFQF